MPVPTVTDCWRVVVNYVVGGVPMQNTLYVEAPVLSDPQDVADDVGGAWTQSGSLQDIQTDDTEYGQISVQPFDGSSAPYLLDVTGFTGQTGAQNDSSVPAQVCRILTLRTLVSGRSHRGRLYLGGQRVGFMEAGGARWTEADTITVQSKADTFLGGIQGGSVTGNLFVYSRTLNSTTVVNNILARQYCGTIRNRAQFAETHP